MDWLYYALLLALLVVGLGLTIMNLPGLWLMAAAAGLYALITEEHYLWPWGMVIIVVLCLIGELLEFLGKAAGAKTAGGSKRAMILSIVGGIVGGITFSLPVPILGTIVGVCIGAFAGAMLGQLTVKQDVAHSTLVGWGAAKGTLIGILLKLVVGIVIFLFTAWRALPLGASSVPTPTAPATMPATLPSTTQAVEVE